MKVLSVEDNFLGLEEKYSSYENSEIVILSAPYEHTVSYGGGTKYGPSEIIRASQFVEFYDEEFDNEICFEKGIATLKPIDFKGLADEKMIEKLYKKVKKNLNNDKFVITLGGEHTISAAPIKAHFEKYPEISVLQFDAHSDLRDTYEGSKWSHACVMARVAEFLNPERITQVGVRAQSIEESKFIKEKKIKTFYANQIRRGAFVNDWHKQIADTLSDEIYITFDIDYFDPSVVPATGTPEPDGFFYSETLELLKEIKNQGKRIIGFDLVELAPINGLSHPNILAASLIYKLINFSFASKTS